LTKELADAHNEADQAAWQVGRAVPIPKAIAVSPGERYNVFQFHRHHRLEVIMTPTPPDPSPSFPETPNTPLPSSGWNIHILSPEESERLLRDESRVPAFEFLAELERKYGGDRRDG
jgi:hypothetical protein